MKKISLIFIGIFIIAWGYSQNTLKKTNPALNKTKKTTNLKNTPAIKNKPERILSPQEIREKNVMDWLNIMLDFKNMIECNYNEAYDVISDKKSFLEYRSETDTSATVLIKNVLNQTVNRMVVSFDSIRIKRMVQYALNKKVFYNNEPDNDTDWKNELANSFVFDYDSNRVVTIRKATRGWESSPGYIDRYIISYKNNFVDSIVKMDNGSHKNAIAFYNGKLGVDSIYQYNIEVPGGKVRFQNKYIYTNKNGKEIQKDVVEKYSGINREKAICNNSHLILYETRVETRFQGIVTNIFLHNYDTNGLLTSSDVYNTDARKPEVPTDTLIVQSIPRHIEYFYNDKKQVIKKVITFSDSFNDFKETVDYFIDDFGFITLTKSVKKNISKRIY
jgi:hypothetical protein